MAHDLNPIAFSMLDLVPVRAGRSVADAQAVNLRTARRQACSRWANTMAPLMP